MDPATIAQASQSAMEAVKAEYPSHGIIVIITDVTGQFSMSTNLGKVSAADMLVHASNHLRDQCKC